MKKIKALKSVVFESVSERSLSLLQGLFATHGSNSGLLDCGWILYQLSYQGSSPKTKCNLNIQ